MSNLSSLAKFRGENRLNRFNHQKRDYKQENKNDDEKSKHEVQTSY